ncbi:hypothetical protein [Metabacillus fastidiosus]|uniref:hypothetical protein n=1 Tax=Metabacillus fastidiosus TaxID=1458 RepID=UPI002DB7F846|nr:hypothetical protein [Metabacillus fastidiosus]MEC2074523.1 hypothetical protein [Metabacillus fastidiosus]
MNEFIHNLDLPAKGAWFPITLGVIALVYLLFMPKRLTWREIYFTFGIVAVVAIVVDVFLMMNYLDIFDLGRDPKQEGIGDLIAYGVVPACYAIIFLNYFKEEKKWMYVILFTILSFLSEWMLVQVGYMKLKGWHTWYSIPVVLFVFGVWLPWHLRLMRKE